MAENNTWLTDATRDYRGSGLLQGATVTSPKFETRDQAEAAAARFPKYVQARVSHVTAIPPMPDYFLVRVHVTFMPDDVNGGYNEAGTKRYFAAIRTLDKNALPRTYTPAYNNSIPTEAEFHGMLR